MEKEKSLLYIRKYFFAFLTGFLNGSFGGGGGMVVVPLLQNMGLKRKESHATAIFVILPLCLLSILLRMFSVPFDWGKALPILLGGTIGGGIGSFLLSVLPEKIVLYLFVGVMIFAGVRMLL